MGKTKVEWLRDAKACLQSAENNNNKMDDGKKTQTEASATNQSWQRSGPSKNGSDTKEKGSERGSEGVKSVKKGTEHNKNNCVKLG